MRISTHTGQLSKHASAPSAKIRAQLGKAWKSTQQHALSAEAVPNLTGFNTPARSPVGHTFA
jgi:hypothetical protein